MKKMIFGITVFAGGLIGFLAVFITSIFVPWNYNGIEGLFGFLLGTKLIVPFMIFIFMFVYGLIIIFNEAHKKE